METIFKKKKYSHHLKTSRHRRGVVIFQGIFLDLSWKKSVKFHRAWNERLASWIFQLWEYQTIKNQCWGSCASMYSILSWRTGGALFSDLFLLSKRVIQALDHINWQWAKCLCTKLNKTCYKLAKNPYSLVGPPCEDILLLLEQMPPHMLLETWYFLGLRP